MPEGPPPLALEIRGVEKTYGGIRPLRIQALDIAAGTRAMLVGFDRPAAEAFVNLITGATLPDSGEVVSLGRPTRDLADSDEWLAFVEQFGIVSDRVVLLEAMTVAQNLAISFDLELDPVPPDVQSRVAELAKEAGIESAALCTRVADAGSLLQARVRLARALALDPGLLLLEHATAGLPSEDTRTLAFAIRNIGERRGLTVVGLTADEKFGEEVGGRLLVWRPATGELRERASWKSWPFS